ncbi:MAG: hypothetical protein OEZ34_10320 [Spirochaetia bacterium]|nr:hypothetical protein [Spirochaetia bacterium]
MPICKKYISGSLWKRIPPAFARKIFLFLLILHFSCKEGGYQNQNVFGSSPEYEGEKVPALSNLSIYFFRTVFSPDAREAEVIKRIRLQEIVFRLFDVDLDSENHPVPVASVKFTKEGLQLLKDLGRTQISGLVFITNRTLKNRNPDELQHLSKNIIKKIITVQERNNIYFNDIQIDCDWSLSTKKNYFFLVHQLRNHLNNHKISASATIRLHQIKYFRQTGIPPVERGILMLYNTGDLRNWNTENSILQINTVKKYTDHLDAYPLHLDVALPLFSQTVIFSGGRLTDLISGDISSQLEDRQCFQALTETRYRSVKRCLLKNDAGSEVSVPSTEYLRYETVQRKDFYKLYNIIFNKRNNIRKIYIYEMNQALFKTNLSNDLDRNGEFNQNGSGDGLNREGSAEFYSEVHYENIQMLSELSSFFHSYSSHSGISR